MLDPVLTKVQNQFNEGKTAFVTDRAGMIVHPYGKTKQNKTKIPST